MDNLMSNNNIYLEGTVISNLEFSHDMYGEGFYSFYIEVSRLSDAKDKLNVTISERLLTTFDVKIGADVIIEGQLRSYNKYVDGANRLILTVFARDIYECTERSKNPNQIFLNGFICKRPVYRRTPFGREIADMLLAVNRPYNKSDYIPTIAWGRNSRYSKTLDVGDNIRIWGRLQSREYQKKVGEDVIQKMAYEVSISKMERVDDDGEVEGLEENSDDNFVITEQDII
ncbi:single-stranded DNA-binding protein [Hathewaya limosa]|uniref:Single-stranded DNA-binding protein n=1 Tax=Hathewaya limosa TaxID=1536 RepID=A0ABU0JN96_HATLI|nr:single-stranded DNA-binding protein [Hathewaya limosa]AWZ49172.1 single-stranded DNA-binding protein [Clostridiaceae bacterium 14S0207]MDQ0478550.1 single-stranded DNA-binding protein [Hathewaya limosa]